MGDSGWTKMPSQISCETTAAIATSLAKLSKQQERPFAVVLHGGEPLLLGLTQLSRLLFSLRNALPPECSISMQTNGMLLTQEILDLCSATCVTVSVSIDGPPNIHNKYRIGHTGRGTYDQVLKGIELLQCHWNSKFLFTGLLAVIDPESDPANVYAYFKNLNPPSVDFIYRDGNHSRLPAGKMSVESTEYGRWLAKLLDVYLADGSPIRIRILDDMIKLVLGGSGCKDGVGLTDYGVLIIDTDGSITKNDTLKSSYNGADRFTEHWSVFTDDLADVIDTPEFTEYHRAQRPSSKICLACPELRVCGGGMTLHRWHNDNGYDNPSVYCADQKVVINQIRHYLPLK